MPQSPDGDAAEWLSGCGQALGHLCYSMLAPFSKLIILRCNTAGQGLLLVGFNVCTFSKHDCRSGCELRRPSTSFFFNINTFRGQS